jgi:heat shock protein HtpX
MFRVNGLYGHIQRNNLKTAVLIACFLALAVSSSVVTLQVVAHSPAVGVGSPFFKSLAENGGVFRGAFDNPGFNQTTPRPRPAPPAPRDPNAPPDLSAVPFRFRIIYAGPLVQAAWALAFALVYLVIATWWNGQYIRYALRAKPLKRSANADLYNIVENLAITAGIPCPAIEVVESPQLNAYASGLTPASARVGLTTGLLESLSPREIEAVVAHELTHILYRDSRLMAVTKACLDLVVLKYINYVRRLKREPLRFLPLGVALYMGVIQPAIYLALLLFAAGAVLMSFLAKAMVMQSREFVADAGAVELTKSPEALISALYKVSGNRYAPEGQAFAQAMMISGSWQGIFATHPTLEERVAALRRFGGATAETELAFKPFAGAPAEGPRVRRVAGLAGFDPSSLPASQIAPAPSFGRRNAEPRASVAFREAAPRGSFGLRAAPGLSQGASRAESPQTKISWADVSEEAKEEEGELGGSWFERWVMSGRINRIAANAQSARRQGMRGLRYMYAGVMLFVFVVTAVMHRM